MPQMCNGDHDMVFLIAQSHILITPTFFFSVGYKEFSGKLILVTRQSRYGDLGRSLVHPEIE